MSGCAWKTKATSMPMKISPQYVAGFFDGEGHINKVGSPVITQRDPTILYAIQRRYGGKVDSNYKRGSYRIRFRRYEEGKFFREVTPHSFRLSGAVPMVNHPSLTNVRWKRYMSG